MARGTNDILFRFLSDTKGLESGTRRAKGALSSTDKAMSAVRASAGLLGAAVGARGLVDQFNQAVGAASDYTESVNAVEVATGDAAEEIMAFGRDAAQSIGMSKTAVNEAAVAFSAFGRQIDSEDLAGTFEEYATRATDFASVMNLDVNRAMQVFQSGLAGESEPLRRFGIDMSAAAVASEAYATGITESGKALTETEKVQARYSLLMKQTSEFQGDFANTSGELANQQRIMAAEMENARIELGEELLPVMLEATKVGVGFAKMLSEVPRQFTRLGTEADKLAHRLSLGLIGNISAARNQLDEFNDTVRTVHNRLEDGKNPVNVYADWVAHMGKEAFISTDLLSDMANEIGLTDEQVAESTRLLIANADAFGLTAIQVQILQDELRGLQGPIATADDAMIGYADAVTATGDSVDGLGEDLDILARKVSIGQKKPWETWTQHIQTQVNAAQAALRGLVIPGLGTLPGTRIPGGPGTSEQFHGGGHVPGPPGQEHMALLRGGEQVLTNGQQNNRGGGGPTINVTFEGVVGDPVAVAEQIQDLLELYGRTNSSF